MALRCESLRSLRQVFTQTLGENVTALEFAKNAINHLLLLHAMQ